MSIRMNNISRTRQSKAIVPRKYRGDTMIEVLVTVLILAVGVLGVAAMQVTTLKNLNSSYSTGIAAIVTDDFVERMRANGAAALADTYIHSAAPTGTTDCVGSVCDATQMASYDMESWWASLAAALPLATGQVTRVGGTNTFIVTVRWDDDRNGSTGTNCPVQSSADRECYQFRVTI
ncbi:MAG: type IV pilus modification protein PilV [Gammaproteobacteria bacterium]|nr:type IV pilus modification protein PilV [Gammaproteobacteria bacterium]